MEFLTSIKKYAILGLLGGIVLLDSSLYLMSLLVDAGIAALIYLVLFKVPDKLED